MKFLIELLPIILFFVAYKLFVFIPLHIIESINSIMPFTLNAGQNSDAIYFATLVAIFFSGFNVVIHYLRYKEFDKNQTITFVLFILLGGARILMRDPAFIKWKPSVINFIFALIFLGSCFIGEKPLVQRFFGSAFNAPKHIWYKLNHAWIVFFVVIAAINLYIAYNFSEETWVNFKLFGLTGLTFAFVIVQVIILSRYISTKS